MKINLYRDMEIVYGKEAITSQLISDLLPTYLGFWKIYYLFIFAYFLGSILTSVIKRMIAKDDSPAPFSGIIFHAGALAILYGLFPVLMSSIIALCNMIADQFMTVDESINMADSLWRNNKSMEEKGLVGFAFSTLGDIVSYGFQILAFIVFNAINIVRFFLLGILLLMAPIVLPLSLNPMYGVQHLKEYMMTIIQVSSWTIIKSVIDLFMKTFTSDGPLSNTGFTGDIFTNNLAYTAIMATYLAVVLNIPLIAKILFKGANFQMVAYTSALFQKGGMMSAGKGALLAGKGTSYLGGASYTNLTDRLGPSAEQMELLKFAATDPAFKGDFRWI